jgi:selenocysteine lyase/cysteine desulfurase
VEVVLPIRGVVPTEALAEAVDDRTVLLAVSEVQSMHGYRVDLPELRRCTQEVGARLYVDLTQSLGALRFDSQAVAADYAAVHGYKWMLAPRGAAWLYVAPSRMEELKPLAPGWKSGPDPYAESYGGPLEYATDARRLDDSLAWFPWVGAKAALEVLVALNASEEVEYYCVGLANRFRTKGEEAGLEMMPQGRPSQIVGVSVRHPEAVQHRLAVHRIAAIRLRHGILRVGFHGFNTARDVDTALSALTIV